MRDPMANQEFGAVRQVRNGIKKQTGRFSSKLWPYTEQIEQNPRSSGITAKQILHQVTIVHNGILDRSIWSDIETAA